MNYAEIKYYDIANGPGVRTSLFVSGCTHRCRGCFNKIAWDFRYGRAFTASVCEKIYESCEPEYIAGITVLGGEPMEPENQSAVYDFIRGFKEKFPDKSVWCYSGYTYEELIGESECRAHTELSEKILDLADVLVDGEFDQDKSDITLRFCGSSNQRIIDIKKTKNEGYPVLWKDDPMYSSHDM